MVCAEAQTYYYAHTKTVYPNGRVEVQSGDNGQFVRRENIERLRVCYDCTRSGRNHLNGNLQFVGLNNGNEVYKGKCYFGPNTSYQFDDSKGLLNVKDANGTVYVYRRREAPAGRTRSSLLIPGAAKDGYDFAENMPVVTNPYANEASGSSGSSGTTRRERSTYTTSDRSCGYCHGGGRVRAHIGVSGFGVSNEKRKCRVCGEYYFVTCDHWHACPQCKGTGRL